MDIKILKLEPNRWEEYKNLRLESLKNEPTAFAASYEEKAQKEDEYWQNQLEKFSEGVEDAIWFAEVDGKLVGMAGWYRSNTKKLRHTTTIYTIYVNLEFRGQGIAQMLISKVMEDLESKPEIVKIDLNVNTQNEAAVNLYKKLGFEIVGTLHKEVFVDGIYYDEYEMEKIIK